MAGPNPEAFQRALTKFCSSLSPSQAQGFRNCSLKEVQDTVRDLQIKQGPGGKLRYLGRLSAFVEAIDQFGKVLDLFVNSNDLVCFIWV